MARREDVQGRLGEIKCPALCVVGVEDAISPPREMHWIATTLAEPGVREVKLLEVEFAGHMAPMENPAAVTSAIAQFAREVYQL